MLGTAAAGAGIAYAVKAAASWVKNRITWKRVLVLGLFGGLLVGCGGFIASLASPLLTSFRFILGNAPSFIVNDSTTYNPSLVGSAMFHGIPAWVRYVGYCVSLDWILWACVSILNFQLWGFLLRRYVRWGLSVLHGIWQVV